MWLWDAYGRPVAVTGVLKKNWHVKRFSATLNWVRPGDDTIWQGNCPAVRKALRRESQAVSGSQAGVVARLYRETESIGVR